MSERLKVQNKLNWSNGNMSKIQWGIGYYHRTVVEKIIVFESEEEFKLELIKLLSYKFPTLKEEEKSTIELIKDVNNYYNITDGNDWRLMYKFTNNIGLMLTDD